MNKTGPIIIIEDDRDDIDFYYSMFEELNIPNEIKIFDDGQKALAYLHEPDVKPFLILSDVSMHPMGGFEIRKTIAANPELMKKCIPYIFYTTSVSPAAVEQAYNLSVQGLFHKPENYDRWKELIRNMVIYWTDCISPNSTHIFS
jgi:CheY-like chemotaxis protein